MSHVGTNTLMGPPAGMDRVEATTLLLANDQVFRDLASALCLRVIAGTVPSVVVGSPQTGQKSGNLAFRYLILTKVVLFAKDNPLLLLQVHFVSRAYNVWCLEWKRPRK